MTVTPAQPSSRSAPAERAKTPFQTRRSCRHVHHRLPGCQSSQESHSSSRFGKAKAKLATGGKGLRDPTHLYRSGRLQNAAAPQIARGSAHRSGGRFPHREGEEQRRPPPASPTWVRGRQVGGRGAAAPPPRKTVPPGASRLPFPPSRSQAQIRHPPASWRMCRAGSREGRAGGRQGAERRRYRPRSPPPRRPPAGGGDGAAGAEVRAGPRGGGAGRPAASRVPRRRVAFPRKRPLRGRGSGRASSSSSSCAAARRLSGRLGGPRRSAAPPDPASPRPRVAPGLGTGPRRCPLRRGGSAGLLPGPGVTGDRVPRRAAAAGASLRGAALSGETPAPAAPGRQPKGARKTHFRCLKVPREINHFRRQL